MNVVMTPQIGVIFTVRMNIISLHFSTSRWDCSYFIFNAGRFFVPKIIFVVVVTTFNFKMIYFLKFDATHLFEKNFQKFQGIQITFSF